LKVSQKIQDKIDFLCQAINKVEWSGVLFYSVKGSIKEFDKVELTIEDIYPMDKGDAGSTGYELGEDFVEYRMNNPETLAWKVGMVHSHHHMKAYFSSVDMSELNDNTEFHNYYLSLVVNNHGMLVAKVALRGNINGYGCKDEKGEDWTLKLSNARQVMFTFDCKIETPKVLTKVPEDFAKRTKEIISIKDRISDAFQKKAKQYQTKKSKYPQKQYPGFFKPIKKNLPPYYDKGNPFDSMTSEETDDEMADMEAEMWNASFSREPIKGKTDMTDEERYWDFARYCLRLADDTEIVGDSFEDALEESEHVEDKAQYLNSIITMYPAMFEKYWDIFGEIDTERFITITSEILDVFDHFKGLFDIVDPVVNSLELMVTKMNVT
jgi:proteasome lid subunit RPN8/RPN11